MAAQKEKAYEDDLFAGLATGREEGISIGLKRGLTTGREEGISIGLEQGVSQGAYQNKLERARNLLEEGLAPQMMARCTGLPLETVKELV